MRNRRRNEWRTIVWAPALAVGALTAAMLGEWAVRQGVSPWIARPLALVAVALQQNGLQMLHHEGAHGHFFRNPFWNEAWTDFWCGVPFFDFVRSYRYFHFQHHRHVGDPELDPELGFYAEQGYRYQPLVGKSLLKTLILDGCGYHYFQFTYSFGRYLIAEARAGRARRFFGPREAITFLLFWAGLLALQLTLGVPFVVYWLVAQATILFSLLKLRGYAEHAGRAGELGENTFSYSHLPRWLRLAVWPFRGYLHREHHRRPDLPWYRLQPDGHAPAVGAPFYQRA